MRTDLPTGTVTFLFTDVEGSTKLLHELGAEAYADALAEHRRVIRDACAAEGGVEVDTQGDAFFFAFPTAPRALAAAEAMTEEPAFGPIHVRIGLHTGTPLLTDEGYVGDAVHRAARIAAAGHGGQVLVSASTAQLVELELADLGEHRLKDLSAPERIYQLGDGSFPPLKTISNTNLPRPASSFVGRDDELLEVLSRVEDGARLLTLTGPGGTGKTRLAIEAAATLVPDFKAGVFWVGLATLRDPALVTETIAQTLGARNGLAEHIGERELLLLLDNLEQVIDAAPELGSLVEACPNLTLLCTSRELLRIHGEVEYAVPPLAESEAVELFSARSQLSPDETVAELCRRLDELPLAVELAAARTSVLTPEQILDRLSQRLDLLKGGRDADPRQQTLRATIEWSYDLLTPEQQQLFARLSVFAGSCTLEAAETVCDAENDTLQSLVEKSLLRFADRRYWMLETVREYATERLVDSGEESLIGERHAEHYLKLAEAIDVEHLRTRRFELLDRLDPDAGNLRAALNWWRASASRQLELRLASALWAFWRRRGYLGEGRYWLEGALDAPQPAELRARALRRLAELAYRQGDRKEQQRLVEDSLVLYRQMGDERGTSTALIELGDCEIEVGDFERAEALLREGLGIASAMRDSTTTAVGLRVLGTLSWRRGDFQAARELVDQSLALSREFGHGYHVAASLAILGAIDLGAGRAEAALPSLLESLELFTRDGWTTELPGALDGLAAVLATLGTAAKAAKLLGAAEVARDELAVGMDWFDSTVHARAYDATAALLDNQTFEETREDGREMSLDEAVEYALSDID